MEQKKITKRERFTEMRAMFEEMGRTDLVEFVDHELSLLDKKTASRSKADLEKAKANEGFIEVIIGILSSGAKMTVSEIMKADERLSELSNQKVSSLLNSNTDLFGKITEKGKSVFFTK